MQGMLPVGCLRAMPECAVSFPSPDPLPKEPMSVYVIADCEIHDPERYEQYKPGAPNCWSKPTAANTRPGGELTIQEDDSVAPAAHRAAAIPSADQARAFYASPAYQEVLAIQQGVGQAQLRHRRGRLTRRAARTPPPTGAPMSASPNITPGSPAHATPIPGRRGGRPCVREVPPVAGQGRASGHRACAGPRAGWLGDTASLVWSDAGQLHVPLGRAQRAAQRVPPALEQRQREHARPAGRIVTRENT